MQFRAVVSTATLVLAALAASQLTAQSQAASSNLIEEQNNKPHHQYKLVDLGTLGGPQSFYFSAPVVQSVNNAGTVVGGADTASPDPFSPNCFSPDCQVIHAFHWHDGKLTDLGTLPGGVNSAAGWVNERGRIMGGSENGIVDPAFGGPQQIAVVWIDGQIVAQGTLGGGISFGNSMNSSDQVVGVSLNAIPDQFSMLGFPTQTRAFLWEGGAMKDLQTLGGPDAWAASINERGQVVGWSYTDSTPNDSTGLPTQHPFLWERGEMIDLHTLGGTVAVTGSFGGSGGGCINDRGQIIGTSNLRGDQMHHAFLSEPSHSGERQSPKDLGTLGGSNSEAYWINDAGEIVGRADLAGSMVHHATLWKDGKTQDLGASPEWPCSTAIDINAKGQIIIDTGICGVGGGPGLLWEDGTLYDLNALLTTSSDIKVGDVNFISDRGEIAVTGTLPDGNKHAVLLVPCDREHSHVTGCEGHIEEMVHGNELSVANAPNSTTNFTLIGPATETVRDQRGSRYHPFHKP